MELSVSQVEALLQLPMDPDAVTGEPNHTPLMLASGNGHLDVVRLLLEAGAQKDALMWAALEGLVAEYVTFNLFLGDISYNHN